MCRRALIVGLRCGSTGRPIGRLAEDSLGGGGSSSSSAMPQERQQRQRAVRVAALLLLCCCLASRTGGEWGAPYTESECWDLEALNSELHRSNRLRYKAGEKPHVGVREHYFPKNYKLFIRHITKLNLKKLRMRGCDEKLAWASASVSGLEQLMGQLHRQHPSWDYTRRLQLLILGMRHQLLLRPHLLTKEDEVEECIRSLSWSFRTPKNMIDNIYFTMKSTFNCSWDP
ncbi:interleukin-34 [Lampetra planeri]